MAHQLDDRAFVTRLDPKGMFKLTEEFPKQCRDAYSIASQVQLPVLSNRPSLIMLTGLGGSAAGGDFARALFENQGGAPFLVNRDYVLPNYVGVGDIVFAASYSGNTEETLAAYDDAKTAGATIFVVTSGGKLAEKAREDKNTLFLIPGGQPPRTALGFMMIPVLVACQKLKLIPEQDFNTAFKLLDASVKAWAPEVAFEQNPAKQLAEKLVGKLGVIYGLGPWQGVVANRWKGQINENAKSMIFANAFPELNHNEILGWAGADKQGVAQWFAVILEDGSESDKMKARAKVTEKLVGKAAEFHHVKAQGSSLIEKLMTLTFYGDYVSLYMAALNGVDPENIDAINSLKTALAKIS